MLKLKTDLRLKSRLALKCSLHPRYNPEKDGAGAIRGGCNGCTEVLQAYQARQRLLTAFKDYELKSSQFETAKRRGTSVEGNR